MSSTTTGGSSVTTRPRTRRAGHVPAAPARTAPESSARSAGPISVVRLKQAAVQLTGRSQDDAAWATAEQVLETVDRWVWAAPGGQLGRAGEAHRALDPVVADAALLDAPPAQPTDEEQYGLSAAGKIVAQRSWIGGSGPLLHAYVRDGAELFIHRWDAAGKRAGIELVCEHADGRLAYTVDVNASGECFGERYSWSGEGLQAVELVVVSSSARPQARRVRVTDRFVYAGR
ncbi:MAG: hypothetical protein JHD16_10380 [Solirubrobacteraceae bacterium]|nr:hypothetical protein [Solirubrobacteraceae bacterium]